MIRRIIVSVVLCLNMFAVSAALAPAIVSAQGANAEYCGKEGESFFNFPTWYKYLSPHSSGGQCELRIQFPEAIPAILLAVFEILLWVVGLLAVVFVIYGGFQYLTSTGEPDKAKGARTTIINALVGMAIAMFATVIVNLVGRNIAP